ncbi:hypothetical protein, partial [Pseudomonas syringae]|uniref:hypothetical protein n=1 Tax=Pseudomonas syringae TaxID=317 RepID=UPI001EEA8104
DGFSEIHRLGVEVHFFDFGVGSHHGGGLAPEKNWEHSIKLQLSAWNVGFMRRLPRLRNSTGHRGQTGSANRKEHGQSERIGDAADH